ncbi:SURF1 family protein [Variovorax sp. ZT4R33]|uniref:SURF1 family protein n=1 Tax=Variovorax sp. ZT4R33 TaxID=3443743 RepID=UPI003F4557E3
MSLHPQADPAAERGPRSAAVLAALAFLALLVFCGFVALGIWQVERRAWKLDLIERVAQRIHAAPVDAPAQAAWPQVDANHDEYRRVRVVGAFLHDRETLVQASTAIGTGFWVLTPLRVADGSLVMVNRGFVPPEQRDPASRGGVPIGTVTVTGFLRMSERNGFFPRGNDPIANRWFSRELPAIAAARGLGTVAPYFVDADAGPPETWPVGGLTVIAFPNSHFVYAVTWFGLALMVALAAAYVAREERRLRRRHIGENARSIDSESKDAAQD